VTFTEGQRGRHSESFERADFTCTCTKIQPTPGERRGQGSVGDRRKGEIGVMTYLHCMRID